MHADSILLFLPPTTMEQQQQELRCKADDAL
jgi:hypothetical protein